MKVTDRVSWLCKIPLKLKRKQRGTVRITVFILKLLFKTVIKQFIINLSGELYIHLHYFATIITIKLKATIKFQVFIYFHFLAGIMLFSDL